MTIPGISSINHYKGTDCVLTFEIPDTYPITDLTFTGSILDIQTNESLVDLTFTNDDEHNIIACTVSSSDIEELPEKAYNLFIKHSDLTTLVTPFCDGKYIIKRGDYYPEPGP